MTIKTEPFLSGKWGWEEGEGDWKDGVDENFLKFSYMINATLDSFVSSLPPSPTNGTAYFLSTDNTLNARVEGEWRKFPIPKGYVVTMKADGAKFEWTGSTFAVTTNLADKTKLDGIATGATLNASDASLRDRATHTGAQVISTVTGLQAALDGKLPLTGGSIAGGLTVSSSIQSPILLTYNSVPVHLFKDTDTAGSGIRGYTSYYDMDGVVISYVGFIAGDGKYEIVNTGRPVKITSSVLDVVGDITTASLNASGNVTASTFNGSGAGLTGVPTTAITGITTVGANLVQTANPNAVTFPRINADNTVTYRSAANLLSDIAAVGVAGTQTISGDKTFSGTTLFTGATTTNNLTSNDSVTVSGVDPHLYIKDSNTSGSTIAGTLEFKDSGGNTKGSIGYNGDGLLRVINSNGGGVGVDTAVRVTGTLPFITLTDTDTSGTIAKGFVSFVDSLGATNAALGMIDGDGRFKFYNPSREFYFDASNVKSLGTVEAVGALIGTSASIAGTLTAGGLSTGGTVSASGTITSGTSISAPTVTGSTASFSTYSGGAATLTGTSQLSKLGVATASLGSDVLAVNGTSTFYGHTVINGNVTATSLIGGGASITGLTKSQVGLSNVDNTSDVNKPVSTATQAALNAKVSTSGNESISGLKTFTTGVQTGTINAVNGTAALAVSSTGGVVAQDYLGQKYSREHQWNWVHDGTLYTAVDIIIDSSFGWGEIEINLSGAYGNINNVGYIKKAQQVGFSGIGDFRSGSLVSEYNAVGTMAARYHISDLYYSEARSAWVSTITTLYSASDNAVIIRAKLTLQDSQSNQALRGLTLSGTYTGTAKTAYPTGLSVPSLQADSATIGGNATAANFYTPNTSATSIDTAGGIRASGNITATNITAAGVLNTNGAMTSGSVVTGAVSAGAITASSSTLSGTSTSNYSVISNATQSELRCVDSANALNFAKFYYHAPSGSAVMERSEYRVIDASSTQTWIGDQVGAPLLSGNTTITKLYRGGTEVLSANATDVKLGRNTSDLVLASNATETYVKHAGTFVFQATAGTLHLYRDASKPVVLSGASSVQYFSPSAPVITATTTTLNISSGNGASCLNINSSGGGIMKHQAYTVATVPAASSNTDCSIVVTDAATGRGLFLSDGTNWRNVANGTILA